ncbi:MAG TPA: hypothetical protein VFC33_07250 [Acidimicrobiia bacterium]|nr:hypothetical protein [Acidimicrobiia bacterium]
MSTTSTASTTSPPSTAGVPAAAAPASAGPQPTPPTAGAAPATRPSVEVRAAAVRRTGDRAATGSGVNRAELEILAGFVALVALGAFFRRLRPPIV